MALSYRILRIEKDQTEFQPQRDYLAELLDLSKAWADEKTCPSYDPNEPDAFLDTDFYAALDGERIVGYAMGHTNVLQKKSSYNKPGETAFELDELYVAPAYRALGVGRALYRFVESEVAGQADVITLIAVSYRYKDLLRFYCDELGMSFNYALLVKRTDRPADQ